MKTLAVQWQVGIALTAFGVKQHAVTRDPELALCLGLFTLDVCATLDDGDVLQISLMAVRLNQGFLPIRAWLCKF